MDPNNAHWEAGYEAAIRNQAGRIAELEDKFRRQPRVPRSELLAVQKQLVFLRTVISDQSRTIVTLVAERDALIAERNN
jgi:hypothetical protein